MTRNFIDLSIPLETGVPSDPKGFGPQITYMAHDQTFAQIAPFFPGLKREQMLEGEGWAVEQLTLSTHNGTHMDAPWHYHSSQDAALPTGLRRSMTIDEVPLDWCMRPGVKLDFTAIADGDIVSGDQIEAELARIGHTLQPFDIVLTNTRAGRRYGSDDFVDAGCGFGRDATLYLTERGVRVVGTDAWSWDAPFVHTAKRWAETQDPSIIWEGHKAGHDIGYFQMEKMHNLEALPATGFIVCCFPIKIKGAGAGWTRAVAIVDEATSV